MYTEGISLYTQAGQTDCVIEQIIEHIESKLTRFLCTCLKQRVKFTELWYSSLEENGNLRWKHRIGEIFLKNTNFEESKKGGRSTILNFQKSNWNAKRGCKIGK